MVTELHQNLLKAHQILLRSKANRENDVVLLNGFSLRVCPEDLHRI